MAEHPESGRKGSSSSKGVAAPTNFAFLDSFSDPQKDSSDPNVKKFIKTWSARNRSTGPARPPPKPADPSKDAPPSFVKGGTGGKGWRPGHLFRVNTAQGHGSKSAVSGEAGPRRRKKAAVREQQQSSGATKPDSPPSRRSTGSPPRSSLDSRGTEDSDDYNFDHFQNDGALVPAHRPLYSSTVIDGLGGPISASPTDPFDTLPIPADASAHKAMHMYLNCDLTMTGASNEARHLRGALIQERKTKWFRYALESPAAYCALVAYFESARTLLSEPTDPAVLRKYLGQALSDAQKELSNPLNLSGDTTLFAIFVLMLCALRMNDRAALKHHGEGLCLLLDRRRNARNPSHSRSISPTSVDNQERIRQGSIATVSSASSQDSTLSRPEVYTGSGYADLTAKGYLSERFWSIFQSNVLVFNPTVMYGRDDAFFTKLWTHHMFLDGGPSQGVASPSETVVIATLRVRWHIVAWPGCGHSCGPIRRWTSRIATWLPHTDLAGLTETDPDALLWILLIAGPHSKADPSAYSWFAQLLTQVIESTGSWDFASWVPLLRHRWLWHTSLEGPAEQFWNESLGFRDAYGLGEVDESSLCDTFSLLAVTPLVRHGNTLTP